MGSSRWLGLALAWISACSGGSNGDPAADPMGSDADAGLDAAPAEPEVTFPDNTRRSG